MQDSGRISFDLPLPDEQVFRYAAMSDVLHQLIGNRHEGFTRRELATSTGYDESTIYRAVELLEKLGAVAVSDDRPARIAIDHDHLDGDDPLLLIAQSEFRAPIRTLLESLRDAIQESERVDRLAGIIVFGSVARGEADRVSDIDLFVVIEGDRTRGRRIAHATARDLESMRFDGDRYEYEVLVETVDSATRVGERLTEIFEEGIVLHRTDALDRVRTAVYDEAENDVDADRQ